MAAPPFCHWYDNGAVPVAVTVNAAVLPTVTVWFAGWAVITGAVAAGGVLVGLSPPDPPQLLNMKVHMNPKASFLFILGGCSPDGEDRITDVEPRVQSLGTCVTVGLQATRGAGGRLAGVTNCGWAGTLRAGALAAKHRGESGVAAVHL
jgi:hypothetical protein